MHDAVQTLEFSILSPFTRQHFRLSWSGFAAIPPEETEQRYREHYAQKMSRSAKDDAASRTEPVTVGSLVLFVAAIIGCFLTYRYL